jgi:hypothetical protein
MTHTIALDDLDQLGFAGEPFHLGTWITGAPQELEPRQFMPKPVGTVEDAVGDLIRVVRASVAEAHASALEALQQLQHRTAAAIVPLEGLAGWEERSW